MAEPGTEYIADKQGQPGRVHSNKNLPRQKCLSNPMPYSRLTYMIYHTVFLRQTSWAGNTNPRNNLIYW